MHHKVFCKINYIIYLLEYLLCKIQYVGKLETPFYYYIYDIQLFELSPSSYLTMIWAFWLLRPILWLDHIAWWLELVHSKYESVSSNSTRANFLYGIRKPYLKMNIKYISKFRYTLTINLVKWSQRTWCDSKWRLQLEVSYQRGWK